MIARLSKNEITTDIPDGESKRWIYLIEQA
jgi:hypothetical protein